MKHLDALRALAGLAILLPGMALIWLVNDEPNVVVDYVLGELSDLAECL